MRRNYLLSLYIISLLSGCHRSTIETEHANFTYPNRRALIVAISNYPAENGWKRINANYDIPLIKAALAAQGFDTLNNVKVIHDPQATKSGILQAIQTWLIDSSKPGDINVFHFSGHGQQVYDFDGDEQEEDGFDEALVPYDAPISNKNNYRGEKHILDDELNVLFRTLRSKLGRNGNLWVSLDACHSGTATRANSTPFRGTEAPIIPKGVIIQPRNFSNIENQWNLYSGNDLTLSPMIVFSATQPHQSNHEVKFGGHYVGPLSYALHQTLTNFPATGTYRALFEEVKRHMKDMKEKDQHTYNQDPYSEGMLDYQLFSAVPKSMPQHFTIAKHLNDTIVVLHGGLLSNIQEEATIHFYPPYTYDTLDISPITTGTVISATLWESTVALYQPIAQEVALDQWAIPSKTGSSLMHIRVKLAVDNPAYKLIYDKLSNDPNIEIVMDSFDVLCAVDILLDSLQVLKLYDKEDREFYQKVLDHDTTRWMPAINQAVQSIRRYGLIQFLRKLNLEDPNLPVYFEILPVTIQKNKNGKLKVDQYLSIQDKTNVKGILTLFEGDYYIIRVVNQTSHKAYITILDIFSDHQVESLYPSRNGNPENCVVEANDTLLIPNFYYATEPYGLDYVKLIATNHPIYPESLSRGLDNDESFEWQALLEDILPTNISRGDQLTKEPTLGTVKTLLFETVPLN